MRRALVVARVVLESAGRGLVASPVPSAIAVVTIAIALVLVGLGLQALWVRAVHGELRVHGELSALENGV